MLQSTTSLLINIRTNVSQIEPIIALTFDKNSHKKIHVPFVLWDVKYISEKKSEHAKLCERKYSQMFGLFMYSKRDENSKSFLNTV